MGVAIFDSNRYNYGGKIYRKKSSSVTTKRGHKTCCWYYKVTIRTCLTRLVFLFLVASEMRIFFLDINMMAGYSLNVRNFGAKEYPVRHLIEDFLRFRHGFACWNNFAHLQTVI